MALPVLAARGSKRVVVRLTVPCREGGVISRIGRGGVERGGGVPLKCFVLVFVVVSTYLCFVLLWYEYVLHLACWNGNEDGMG